MGKYTQDKKPLAVTTPLGKDALLLVGLTGSEGMSQLAHYQLELLAENGAAIAFDQVIGQPICVTLQLAKGKPRYFTGICSRFGEGERGHTFTSYFMVVVPRFWLWTRKSHSRIFQQLTVPDILKKVLTGLEVEWKLSQDFQPRNYCVQYRETDFNFASRLMEEEGIFYYFSHDGGKHKMVVTNNPLEHPDVPGVASVNFEPVSGAFRDEERVHSWMKRQELRSGKYTLWDHWFELPHQHLDGQSTTQGSVAVGKATHKLGVGGNESLEIFDYPGGYSAGRFDGIDPGGSPRGEASKIAPDGKRTVKIRMEEEAAAAVEIQGASNCGAFTAGYKFKLQKHGTGDGAYYLKSVTHHAQFDGYRSSSSTEPFRYSNTFDCVPVDLPYRPARLTPRPIIAGTQTAVVVGPKGHEIFTDKYSRVKVQFHWDSEGKNDQASSCWVRVGTPWAGKHWGMIHIPRIGQEVIVDFLEGDPDRPLILGSVYNADQMPPYDLPDAQTQSGIKSRSSLKGTPENYNEIRFEDKKGEEVLYIHAEKNQDIVVENDEQHSVGHDRRKSIKRDETTTVGHDRTENVGNDEKITIAGNRTESVSKSETVTISDSRNHSIGKDDSLDVSGNKNVNVGKDLSTTVAANQTLSVTKSQSIDVGGSRTGNVTENDTLDVGKILSITAGDQIVLKTGSASITMKKNGDILIEGKNIKVTASGKMNLEASSDVTVKGSKVKHN